MLKPLLALYTPLGNANMALSRFSETCNNSAFAACKGGEIFPPQYMVMVMVMVKRIIFAESLEDRLVGASHAQPPIDGCPAESIEARTTKTTSTLRQPILPFSYPQCIPSQLPRGSANLNLAPALNHIPLHCALASDGSPTLARARARERHAVLCWARLR